MRTVTIYSTPEFILTSYGNGAMYKFNDKRSARSLFVQGDDAITFSIDLEAYMSARETVLDALTSLWCDYDSVSIPD